jgi:hypothetical protein
MPRILVVLRMIIFIIIRIGIRSLIRLIFEGVIPSELLIGWGVAFGLTLAIRVVIMSCIWVISGGLNTIKGWVKRAFKGSWAFIPPLPVLAVMGFLGGKWVAKQYIAYRALPTPEGVNPRVWAVFRATFLNIKMLGIISSYICYPPRWIVRRGWVGLWRNQFLPVTEAPSLHHFGNLPEFPRPSTLSITMSEEVEDTHFFNHDDVCILSDYNFNIYENPLVNAFREGESNIIEDAFIINGGDAGALVDLGWF